MDEIVIEFGKGNKLSGMLTIPGKRKTNNPCVVLLNAGMLHKIGPNRLNVDIARNLSEKSFHSFRFDFSGIGDSEAYKGEKSFEERVLSEVDYALEVIESRTGISEFILIGMCSGADIAFNYILKSQKNIKKAVLINGYFVNEEMIELVNKAIQEGVQKRYYLKKILSIKSWYNVFSGKVNIKNASKLLQVKGKTSNNDVDNNVSQFKLLNTIDTKNLTFVYSEGSSALDTYKLYHENVFMSSDYNCNIEIFKNVDHTFTPQSSRIDLVEKISKWIQN
jgi:pimeloyl-ACP methyl ester carboxylesterase